MNKLIDIVTEQAKVIANFRAHLQISDTRLAHLEEIVAAGDGKTIRETDVVLDAES